MKSFAAAAANVCLCSSKMGDVDDFPEVRVDASSPGPRVTFSIQDPVNFAFYIKQLVNRDS